MIAMAKAQPGKLSYATFSFPATYFMDKLNKAEGIDIVKVPYRGGGEVVNAVLGGTTPIAVLALSNMVPQLQSGRITPLAVVANSRSPLFPDVPTLERGAPRRGLSDRRGSACSRRPACRGRSSRRSRATPTASWPSRRSASACTPSARVEPAPERLDEFARFIREERKLAQQIVKESGAGAEVNRQLSVEVTLALQTTKRVCWPLNSPGEINDASNIAAPC